MESAEREGGKGGRDGGEEGKKKQRTEEELGRNKKSFRTKRVRKERK